MARKTSLSGADFTRFRPLRRIPGAFFTLSVGALPKTPSAGGGSASGGKWACVVSKKVALRAVDRNRIKRRCRAILARELAGLRSPLALVFQARKGAALATFAQMEGDLKAITARVLASADARGTMQDLC